MNKLGKLKFSSFSSHENWAGQWWRGGGREEQEGQRVQETVFLLPQYRLPFCTDCSLRVCSAKVCTSVARGQRKDGKENGRMCANDTVWHNDSPFPRFASFSLFFSFSLLLFYSFFSYTNYWHGNSFAHTSLRFCFVLDVHRRVKQCN